MMKIEDTISSLRDRIHPPQHGKLGNFLKIAAGTAATIWVVLQLRRELYGPGGTRMTPYDPDVDDVWDESTERLDDSAAKKKQEERA